MSRSLVVLLFVAICAAGTFAEKSGSESDVRHRLLLLEKDDYARSILDMLQVSVAAGAPVDEIKVLIQRMRSNIVKLQQEEDNSYKIIAANCDSIIASLNSQIPLYERNVDDSKKRKADAETIVRDSQSQLADSQQQLQSAQERLDKGTETRGKEVALTDSKIKRLKEAIEAINQAVKLIQTMKGSGSLVEIDQQIEKIFSIGTEFGLQDLAKYSGEVKQARNSLATSLMQTTDTEMTEQDGGKKKGNKRKQMVSLLNKLGDMFRSALQEELNLSRLAEENWNKVKADLEAEIQTHKGAVTHIQQRLEKSKGDIEDTAKGIDQNQRLLEVSKGSLKDNEAECKRQQKEATDSKTQRNSDLEILDKLLDFFKQNSNALESYIKDRSSQ